MPAKHWSESAAVAQHQKLLSQFADNTQAGISEDEAELETTAKDKDEMALALDFLLNISTGEEELALA